MLTKYYIDLDPLKNSLGEKCQDTTQTVLTVDRIQEKLHTKMVTFFTVNNTFP